MPYLAVICVLLVGVIVYLLRQNALREDAWRLERVALLQRIQDPDLAVIEQSERPERDPLPYIPVDDDAAFAALREARNGAD